MKTNKTLLTLYIITLLCLIPLWDAATQTNGQKCQAQIKYVTALPGTCAPNNCLYYAVIGASPYRTYVCSASNTFTETTNVASAASTPGGANTNIQYNNSGAFGGDADFVYSAASDFWNLTTNAGATAGIKATAASDASRIVFGGAGVPGTAAGIIFGFLGGDNNSGLGIWWSDGTQRSRLNLKFGLNWQGHNSTNDPFYIRKGTGDTSEGTVIFEFKPTDATLTLAPKGAAAGDTAEIRFLELSANGLQYNAIKAADSLASTSSIVLDNGGGIRQTGLTHANLGTPANGTFVYCSDCTIANPCASGGNGALAKRLNGAWVCN